MDEKAIKDRSPLHMDSYSSTKKCKLRPLGSAETQAYSESICKANIHLLVNLSEKVTILLFLLWSGK